MNKLDNQIILYTNNHSNIAEILDYLNEFYIRHNDYNIEFGYGLDIDGIFEVSQVTLHLYTDELKEDGNLAYLIAEDTVGAQT